MILLLYLAIVSTLVYLSLQYNVCHLKNSPSGFPPETLLSPPNGKITYITQSDGTKVRTIHMGTGPVVIFAHDYGLSLNEWNVVTNLISKEGYSIITFDQKGHYGSTIGSDGVTSQSMASVYKSVLEYYDVRDGVLVGHSMGVFLSVVFMLSYPEVVKNRLNSALFISGFSGKIGTNNLRGRLLRPLIASGTINLIINSKVWGFQFAQNFIGNAPNAAMIEALLSEFKKTNHKPLLPIVKAFSNEDYSNRLHEIIIPCTLMVGSEDKITPKIFSENLVSGIPGSNYVVVEGMGHLINWEAPEIIVNEIKKLVQPGVFKDRLNTSI